MPRTLSSQQRAARLSAEYVTARNWWTHYSISGRPAESALRRAEYHAEFRSQHESLLSALLRERDTGPAVHRGVDLSWGVTHTSPQYTPVGSWWMNITRPY